METIRNNIHVRSLVFRSVAQRAQPRMGQRSQKENTNEYSKWLTKCLNPDDKNETEENDSNSDECSHDDLTTDSDDTESYTV